LLGLCYIIIFISFIQHKYSSFIFYFLKDVKTTDPNAEMYENEPNVLGNRFHILYHFIIHICLLLIVFHNASEERKDESNDRWDLL